MRSRFTQLFNKYGKQVVIRNRTETFNNRGYAESSSDSDTTIKAFPMELVITTNQQPFKDMDASDTGLAVPYDTTVSRGDHAIYDGETFVVRDISKHFFPENIVTLLRLAKVVS